MTPYFYIVQCMSKSLRYIYGHQSPSRDPEASFRLCSVVFKKKVAMSVISLPEIRLKELWKATT